VCPNWLPLSIPGSKPVSSTIFFQRALLCKHVLGLEVACESHDRRAKPQLVRRPRQDAIDDVGIAFAQMASVAIIVELLASNKVWDAGPRLSRVARIKLRKRTDAG
jgi:hypothetical protein